MKKISKKGFTTIPSNAIFMEKKLSLKAVGLFCKMASLPDDWEFSVQGLTKITKDGRDSINNACIELEKHGFLKRYQKKNGNVFSNSEYVLFFEPVDEFSVDEFSVDEFSVDGKTHTINILTNKELKNKELTNNKNLIKENSNDNRQAKEVLEYLVFKTNKTYKPTKSNLQYINARLKEGFTVDDCKKVIDVKCLDWLNEKATVDGKIKDCTDWLNPITLFRPQKFENYLNQKAKISNSLPHQELVDFDSIETKPPLTEEELAKFLEEYGSEWNK